jgi:hypothetical protein
VSRGRTSDGNEAPNRSAHDLGDRGYAIYLWPGAQGDDMPPPPQLVADSDTWLARITFNE